MEYLPSGLSCNGHVTHVESLAFNASCTTPAGARRVVRASWSPNQNSAIAGGRIAVQAA
jgi:hypothetical protein